MYKILVSLPEQLAARFKSIVPQRQRSKVICRLIELEIKKREQELYECALAVEQDDALNAEMKEWNITIQDGLKDESW